LGDYLYEVAEAWDKKGKEFGEEGIVGALRNKQGLSPQHDDITIMALKAAYSP